MKKSLIKALLLFVVTWNCGCITDHHAVLLNRQNPGVRSPDYRPSYFAREGLAFSRILTSPVMIPLAGAAEFATNDHRDIVNRTFEGLFGMVLISPVLMVQEIGVGFAEAIACQQFKSQYYPWEHYSMEIEGEQLDWKREYKEKYRREHPNPNLELLGEIASGAAEGAIQGAGQVAVDAAMNKSGKRTGATTGGEASSNSSYGSISGPSNLGCGEMAVYRLYVGGKKVDADWHQNGTSISVYGSGDHARAMGGNPPIKSGKYKTGIRATYNGKTYTKTIYIVK